MLHQLEKEEEGGGKRRKEESVPLLWDPAAPTLLSLPSEAAFINNADPPPPLSHQKWKVGNKSLLPIATALCGLGAPIQVSTSSPRKKIAKSRKAQRAWTRKLSRLS